MSRRWALGAEPEAVMMAAVWAHLRLARVSVVRQRFWVVIGLAVLLGVVGDALLRGWWSQTIPFLAAFWPWLLIVTSGAAVVLRLAWWLWWGLPRQQVDRLRLTDPKARGDAEDNFRKTAGQLLGGAAVLIGAGFAYLQFTQQQQNSREQFLAQQQSSRDQFLAQQKASQEQFLAQQKASQEQLVSNQVSKGFELLGNKDNQIEQRLGGIYALEGVMEISQQYYQPVMDTLCAFVRDGTRNETGDGPPTTDIQAALSVIGRRTELGGKSLEGVYIPNAYLHHANLSGADFTRASLAQANLTGAKLVGALLNGADLHGANFADADLSGATLLRADLSLADLEGANLSGAILEGTVLGVDSLAGAKLIGADLMDADLTGLRLTGVDLSNADLSSADLTHADLEEAKGLTQEQLDQACGTDPKVAAPLKFRNQSCESSLRKALASAPAAPPAPFIVFFNSDQSQIDVDRSPQAMEVVQEAVTAAKRTNSKKIQVTGYTDRALKPYDSLILSKKLAQDVANALARLGIPRERIVVSGRGENDNRVPTGPGVREQQNRRVEIVVF